MLYRSIPFTDLNASILSLGTMQLGWTADEEEAVLILDCFIEAGGNLIDTADNYSHWINGNSGGEAEAIIGRWIASRGNREDVIIATKVGKRMWEGRDGAGLSRNHIIRACETSLKRLKTDYIDLYQCHLDDIETPLLETLSALDELVVCGKVRYIGCSNYSAARFKEALRISADAGLPRFVTTQTLYNVLRRSEVDGLRPVLREEDVGLICYNTLAAGFLTGKYPQDGDIPDSVRARQVRRRYCRPEDYALLDILIRVARERSLTIGQLSLKWVMSDTSVTSAIVGVNTSTQLSEAIGACSDILTNQEWLIIARGALDHR